MTIATTTTTPLPRETISILAFAVVTCAVFSLHASIDVVLSVAFASAVVARDVDVPLLTFALVTVAC